MDSSDVDMDERMRHYVPRKPIENPEEPTVSAPRSQPKEKGATEEAIETKETIEQSKEEEEEVEEMEIFIGGGAAMPIEAGGDTNKEDGTRDPAEPYGLTIGDDGGEEFVVDNCVPGEDFFKEYVAPSDMPPLFNSDDPLLNMDTSGLPKLFNNEMNTDEEKGTQAGEAEEPIGATKTEDEIQFLVKSVQYSRLMSAINDDDKLRDVVKTMHRMNVNNGDVVIQQGDSDHVQTYYVLESGAIDVFVFDQFRVTIQPGWCFGELSFVFGAPRSASCVASADSVLWVLSRGPFDRILAGLSPLEKLKIVRQESDPGDEFDPDDIDLTKLALDQLYGADFLDDKENVRDITGTFLHKIEDAHYVGLPQEVQKVMEHWSHKDEEVLHYNIRTHEIVDESP